jgi:ABC-2 type transport system permease protein
VRGFWPIFKRELWALFVTPIAWVLVTMFLLVQGIHIHTLVSLFATDPGQGDGSPVQAFFGGTVLLYLTLLFVCPLITMRLFAEEKRSGTIELLTTSPITDVQVIIGKWLSAVLMYAFMLLSTVLDILFLFRYGNPDWKPLAIGYLGLLLQAGGLIAIGTFISTLTRNQIIAGAVTFGVCLMLWVLGWVSQYENATWAQVLSYMCVITHFDSFAKGVLDTKDAIFDVTVIFLGLFFTARSMESMRWRS